MFKQYLIVVGVLCVFSVGYTAFAMNVTDDYYAKSATAFNLCERGERLGREDGWHMTNPCGKYPNGRYAISQSFFDEASNWSRTADGAMWTATSLFCLGIFSLVGRWINIGRDAGQSDE